MLLAVALLSAARRAPAQTGLTALWASATRAPAPGAVPLCGTVDGELVPDPLVMDCNVGGARLTGHTSFGHGVVTVGVGGSVPGPGASPYPAGRTEAYAQWGDAVLVHGAAVAPTSVDVTLDIRSAWSAGGGTASVSAWPIFGRFLPTHWLSPVEVVRPLVAGLPAGPAAQPYLTRYRFSVPLVESGSNVVAFATWATLDYALDEPGALEFAATTSVSGLRYFRDGVELARADVAGVTWVSGVDYPVLNGVSAVPEPASWALVASGLTLPWCAARARRGRAGRRRDAGARSRATVRPARPTGA